MVATGAADDAELMATLTELINDVYSVAEEGLWIGGSVRTTVAEVTELARSGQLAVARRNAEVVGCVRVQFVDDQVGEFGMLAVLPRDRGSGTGRALVDFAQDEVRRRQGHTMQLEVLTPRERSHPSKEFIIGWYTRMGYQLTSVGAIEESYPHLAPHLATSCDFAVYRRSLEPVPGAS